MCSFCCLLYHYQSFMRKEKGKISYRKKIHRRIFERISLFWLYTLLSVPFCCFLRLLSPHSQVTYFRVFYVMMSWRNSRKYENLLQNSTSWLTSLRMWSYFRLCFSFSCSGYDFTVLGSVVLAMTYKNLQTKTYKLVVGYCDNSIYC